MIFLSGQLQLFAFQHFGDVQVKEVAVQDRLNDTSNNGDDIIEAWKYTIKQVLCKGIHVTLNRYEMHKAIKYNRWPKAWIRKIRIE